MAFGPVPGCTHITHTQCGAHKFLTIFKFISSNFKLQRAISRTSSCICFSQFPSPLGLCVRFGGEKETEPSQEKQSLAKVFPQRKQENMRQLAYLLATYYYLACKWPKVVASSRKWSKVMWAGESLPCPTGCAAVSLRSLSPFHLLYFQASKTLPKSHWTAQLRCQQLLLLTKLLCSPVYFSYKDSCRGSAA